MIFTVPNLIIKAVKHVHFEKEFPLIPTIFERELISEIMKENVFQFKQILCHSNKKSVKPP